MVKVIKTTVSEDVFKTLVKIRKERGLAFLSELVRMILKEYADRYKLAKAIEDSGIKEV